MRARLRHRATNQSEASVVSSVYFGAVTRPTTSFGRKQGKYASIYGLKVSPNVTKGAQNFIHAWQLIIIWNKAEMRWKMVIFSSKFHACQCSRLLTQYWADVETGLPFIHNKNTWRANIQTKWVFSYLNSAKSSYFSWSISNKTDAVTVVRCSQ